MTEQRPIKTTCKSCPAEIYWLLHVKTLKRAPIDCATDPAGRWVVMLEDGKYRGATETDPNSERHHNHFYTCPDRDKYGKRGSR